MAFAASPALETLVEVEFQRGHHGWGPSYHYTYDWIVSGITAPVEGKLPPSTADRLFGYSSAMLPELQKTADGFRVGYEW